MQKPGVHYTKIGHVGQSQDVLPLEQLLTLRGELVAKEAAVLEDDGSWVRNSSPLPCLHGPIRPPPPCVFNRVTIRRPALTNHRRHPRPLRKFSFRDRTPRHAARMVAAQEQASGRVLVLVPGL